MLGELQTTQGVAFAADFWHCFDKYSCRLTLARQAKGMNKILLLLGLVTLSSAVAAPAYEMKSYAALNGKIQPVFAWCDSPSRVLALTAVSTAKTPLYHWAKGKSGLGSLSVSTVRVGAADAGAGQVYYPLNVVAGSRNGQSGFLHTSNIENVQDPAYRMTHINEFKLGNDIYTCRYVPQAAFMGVTAKRTVIIWDTGDVITYATRNFDGSAGVYVTDGKSSSDELGKEYSFETKDGYTYTLYASPTAAFLTVSKGGKVLSTEKFVAYSLSLPAH